MAENDAVTASDLDYLRKDSLRTVLVCSSLALYFWCVTLLQTGTWFGAAWWGPVLLAGGLIAAFAIQDHNLSLAAAVVILGITAAAFYSMWLSSTRVTPYLLAVVVGLTGLLFSMNSVVWMTILCNGAVIVIGVLRWGYSLISTELLSPALVISAVGILSSLAVRNLYMTLYWVWDRAMAAQRNEEQLLDRQAELARTVKALDEAYRRLEHLNYDLARAREVAEEARVAKQRFATSVSHELRTPLNVIVAFSETMYLSPESYGGVPLPPEYRGDAREVYRSSRHLLHLIDDVLDMSQIEAGRMRIELEPVDLRHVVAQALDMIRPLVREQDIALRADVPEELPLVFIDRARVQQVLLNLLNNARRFTDRGSITVQAAVEADHVRVTVADTGIGISPSEHESMFKEFHQLDSPTLRSKDGSGLGLAISKRFIEMHGARIWVESDGVPGHGSQFHFTLPLAGTESVALSALQGSRKVVSAPAGRGRTVLLLDQDSTIVRIMEQGLEDYQVVPVDDISQVPGLVDRLHARAVVLNSASRGLAWRRMRELQQRLGDSPVPVALCPLVGERQLAEALGVAAYLVKPVTLEALTTLLDQVGDGVHRILIVDDDPRMTRILSRMLQATGRELQVARAHDGREGLRVMRSHQPDLVLLDMVMPEVDGRGVLAQMQEDDELRHVPVAVITAQTRTPEEERRLGGDMLHVSTGAGLTNKEALAYLRGILDGADVVSPLRRSEEAIQRGQQIGLRDGLAQVGGGTQ